MYFYQGVQRRMVLVVNFIVFLKFAFAIFALVHDLEALL